MIFISFTHGKNAVILTGGHKESKERRETSTLPRLADPHHNFLLGFNEYAAWKSWHFQSKTVHVEYKTRLQYLEKTIWHILLPEILK